MASMNSIKGKIEGYLTVLGKYLHTDANYLARSTFWLNANVVISSLLAFGISVTLARLLPKEAYGTYQFILSLASFVGAFTLTSMNVAIIRAVSRGYEGSFIKSIWYQLKWSIGAFALASGISIYYFIHDNTVLGLAMVLVALFSPVLNTFNTYSAFITGKSDFRRLFGSYQVLNFSFSGAMFLALLLTDSPVYLVLVNFGVNSIVTIFLFFRTIRHYQPNEKEDPETFSLGKHLSLSGLISNAIASLDKILIFHYVGAIDLAIYTFAVNIPDRLFNIIRSITVSALPRFSLSTSTEIQKVITKKSLKFFFLSLIGATIYLFLAPFFFKIFFPTYLESISYSQIYFFMIALSALSMLPYTALNALGLHKELYVFNTASALFKILVIFLLIRFYGPWGLIFSRGVIGIFSYALSTWLIRRAAISEANQVPKV